MKISLVPDSQLANFILYEKRKTADVLYLVTANSTCLDATRFLSPIMNQSIESHTLETLTVDDDDEVEVETDESG